jgi:hypothetical protein
MYDIVLWDWQRNKVIITFFHFYLGIKDSISLCFLFVSWSLLAHFYIVQRNYRFFFLFVSSSTLLCIYVFAMSAFYIKVLMDEGYPTVRKALKHSPASWMLLIYCFIALWFVGGLTGFHLYLISTNQVSLLIQYLVVHICFFPPAVFFSFMNWSSINKCSVQQTKTNQKVLIHGCDINLRWCI